MVNAVPFVLARLADLPAPQPGAEGATERAREILSRGEFAPERRSAVERLIRWIGRRLGDLFGGGGPSSGGASSVFSIIVGVVAIGLLLYVLTKIRIGKRQKADDEDGRAELFIDEMRSQSEWLDEAVEYERAGEWKLALRARYRWLVVGLADAGALQNVPGRTAGELRLQYAEDHPDQAGVFAAATDLFELAWYGNVATGPGENERFKSYATRLLQAAGADR